MRELADVTGGSPRRGIVRDDWFGAYLWRHLRRHPLRAAAFGVVGMMFILMMIGEAIAPYSPTRADATSILEPPSRSHLFGTDLSGFDVFSRVIAAPRTNLGIALAGVFLALACGGPLGTMAGYYAGSRSVASFIGELVMRLADIIQSFPVFILALALVAVSGPSARNVVAAIAFVNFPIFLRLFRAEALTIRERSYVDSARAGGQRDARILATYVGPNAMAPAFVQISVNIGFAILLTAGLSFVGAGVRVPTPEWGSMISIGAPSIIIGKWWPAVFPGVVMGITVLSFAIVGESVARISDPRRRE